MVRRVRQRAGVAVLATAGLGAAGVLLLAMAASGAGPSPYTVVLGGSATPVAPDTATPSPGETLVFVNAGSVPYALNRSATPLALATTIAPGSTSTPYAVPTAFAIYPYTAQLQSPQPLNLGTVPGPTLAAQIVVASPPPAASPAPAPVGSTAAATVAPTGRRTTKAPPRTAKASPASRRSSARPSASASTTAPAVLPGGVLPAPAEPPVFSGGSAVPLPVLPTAPPTAAATGSADAGSLPTAPVTPALTPAAPLPVGPFSADAPRQGPRRSRGLPIALAVVVLLGVGGAVARTLVRTGRRPRRSR